MTTIIAIRSEYTIYYVPTEDYFIVMEPSGDIIGWADTIEEATAIIDGAEAILAEWVW